MAAREVSTAPCTPRQRLAKVASSRASLPTKIRRHDDGDDETHDD